MASVHRRDFLKLPLGAALASGVAASPAQAVGASKSYRSFQLDNGFRTHVLEDDFGYTCLVLSLRSDKIAMRDGLAHLMEHTSFVGAAGSLMAHDVRERWKDHVQDSNASTAPGEITWEAMFLPSHLPQVIELLALTSLQQKFDLPTVEQERQIVLQELYADKYSTGTQASREFDQALYGRDHPLVRNTVDEEIRHARQPAEQLASALHTLADDLRLPANMDLYVLGTIPNNGPTLEQLVAAHFGGYPKRQGPTLKIPPVPPTASHRRLTKRVRDLQPPLAELDIAWNTGVTIGSRDAAALTVVAAYLNSVLFDSLREQNGDAYAPEATFEPGECAGIFYICLSTTKSTRKVERNVFEVMKRIKSGVPEKELARFREQLELTRRRQRRQDDALLEKLVQRNLFGSAISDLDVNFVTADQVKAAAETYLPEYRGRYVRMTRLGRDSS